MFFIIKDFHDADTSNFVYIGMVKEKSHYDPRLNVYTFAAVKFCSYSCMIEYYITRAES